MSRRCANLCKELAVGIFAFDERSVHHASLINAFDVQRIVILPVLGEVGTQARHDRLLAPYNIIDGL